MPSAVLSAAASLGFGFVEVVYREIEVHLFGILIPGPSRRSKIFHLDGCEPHPVGFDGCQRRG
jgi:hypothetical protein